MQFTADAGVDILGLTFSNSPSIDAFEVANFTVTAPVPEPETYVLMLAGLGAVGFMSRAAAAARPETARHRPARAFRARAGFAFTPRTVRAGPPSLPV